MSGVSNMAGVTAGAIEGVKNERAVLRTGQTVEGTVISVEEHIATIKTAGRTITAAVAKGSLDVGEHVKLEITDIQGGTVLAQRVHASETKALHKMGLVLNDENIKNIAELLKNGRPIDRNLLNNMAKNSSEVSMLLEEMASGAEVVDVDEPLKNVLIKLFGQSTMLGKEGVSEFAGGKTGGIESATVNMEAEALAMTKGASSDVVLNASEEGLRSASSAAQSVVKSEVLEKGVSANQEMAFDAGEKGATEEQIVPGQTGSTVNEQKATAGEIESGRNNTGRTVLSQKEAALIVLDNKLSSGEKQEAMRQLLKHFSAKENMLLAVNQKTLTLKNIAAASVQSKELADEVLVFSRAIRNALSAEPVSTGHGAEILRDALKILSGGKGAEHKMMDIAKALHADTASEAAAKAGVLSDASKGFPKQENQSIYYIPVPLMIREEEHRADVYYKKQAHKEREVNILVALNTHHVGEVRCLVNKYKERYVLAFALENKEYSELFESHATHLRRQMSHFDFAKTIDILFRSREQVDADFFGTATLSDFDARV